MTDPPIRAGLPFLSPQESEALASWQRAVARHAEILGRLGELEDRARRACGGAEAVPEGDEVLKRMRSLRRSLEALSAAPVLGGRKPQTARKRLAGRILDKVVDLLLARGFRHLREWDDAFRSVAGELTETVGLLKEELTVQRRQVELEVLRSRCREAELEKEIAWRDVEILRSRGGAPDPEDPFTSQGAQP